MLTGLAQAEAISEDKRGGHATGQVALDFTFVSRRSEGGLRKITFALNQAPGSVPKKHIGHSLLAVGPDAKAVSTFSRPR
ncbi:hypothetical protein [Janthinobacterium agaricidamnosum]|uniref:Uncharacterized protein n=1 Tax=Janthinobacterium agaricidamnosum NBRC 102515 = DSM 9628 TaxID=1349767 RepID=W0V6E5_9BURK|nr:hypothetical protein [Janthinobacterium agaricidamnosum]CDG83180.1 hypothetical protein GJA_2549 [Janthinobacterium agaricidamnosum NBRC 102515 = DSM 9628]